MPSTWWVRPDTSHSAVRDGLSYETAWGGPGEVVYGASGFDGSNNDTLRVCGVFALTVNWSIGAHGGSSEQARGTIRGDYSPDLGFITSSNGSYLNNSRPYTDIYCLTMLGGSGRAANVASGAHYTRWLRCGFTGDGSAGILHLPVANGNTLTDLVVDDCTFTGSCASQGAISQFVTAAGATVSLTRARISGNRFIGVQSPRSIIHLRADTGVATRTITDLILDGNVFEGCAGITIEVSSAFNTYGLNTGLKVRHNVMRGCAFAVGSSVLGGNVIRGFAPSTTPGFGPNEIVYNEIRDLQGQYGGFNLFFGEYRVHRNLMDGIYTETIDGNGVLLDHGNQRCVVTRNRFLRIVGKAGVTNSGCAVMVLDSTDCVVESNHGHDVAVGIYIGAESHVDTGGSPNQSLQAVCNTFSGCAVAGVRLQADAATDNVVESNLFTGPGAAVSSGVTWTGESNNRFYGMAAANGHTLHGSSSTDDPLVNAAGVPLPGSPLLTLRTDNVWRRDIRGILSRGHVGAFGVARLLRQV